MKHLQKFPENLDNVPLTEKNSATLSDGTRRFVGENNIQSDWAQKQVEKGRPRFHTREPPQLNAFDTEARRGNLLVICSPTMHLEYDKAAGPMPLLTWLWEQASDTNFLYNLSYDRDVILKPLSERMKKGDHEVDLGPFNIKLLGNKAFALRFRGDKNIKGSHRIKRFFDVAGFFDDGERHLSLEEASNIFLNSGKLKDVDRARLGEEEGYYEARREETIRYCKRDAELTLKLGELLIKSLHDALGFYPSRFNSKASVAKAWIEVYHPEVMVKKRSSRASLARSSYRGGIFITRVLGRVKDVSELDISCLPDGTMIEGRAIELIQKGDVVNGQTVTDVQTFENAPCIEIETASGHRIISTPNHRHMVPVSGTTKSVPRRADSLRRDGYLRVDDWPSDPLPVDAVITGILHAEGCWVFDKLVWKKDTRTARGGQYGINHSLRITVDERETELRSFIRAYLADRGYHFSETVKRGTHGLTFRLWRETDVRKLKDVYDRVLSSDSELNVRGFLRGFFEGDGTVNGARRSVSAVQSDENKYLAVVDRIHLLDFHPALYTLMRSQTGRAPYTHRRAHAHPDAQTNMIEIVSREVPRWMRLVGFVSRAKRSRVAAKIVSKRLTEPRRVHDITLDGDHTYFANGVWTHNSAYGDALRKIARLDRLTETGWDVEAPQKYHANAQYGAYWILIDYDGRLPMDPRWRNKERGKARIMYANSNGKKRPYTATKAEMDYFISTGRVTEADIVISNEWLGHYEPQFPELQELLDKVRALKEPAKTDPLSAVMRMLFKTVINSAYGCLAESKHGETPFTTWPLAAEITGRCRVSIWKEWDNIVAQGGVILSVNTDSLRYVLPSETVMREHAPIGDFEHKFFKSITTHYQSGIAVIEVPSPPPPPYLRKRGKPLLTYEMLMAAKGPILAIPSRHVTHLFEALNNNNRGRIGVFDNPDDEDDDTCLDLTSNLWALAYNPDHLRFEYLNKTATVGTPYPFDEVTGDVYNSAVRGTREKSGVKKIRKDWEKGRVSLRAVPT